SSTVPSSTTSNSLSILKQYLSKTIGYHNQQTTTTANVSSNVPLITKTVTKSDSQTNITVDSQLEKGLSEIEQSSNQSLQELNNL
ncbi:unnamed protein product, partial [Rotaria magnacalcarata]